MYDGDTIAAIATPPGVGGIGIVRVSGSLSPTIAAKVFRSRRPPHQWRSHHLYFGEFLDTQGRVIDQGLAVLMRAPHSFTGEDVLELHAHGSPIVLQHLLAHTLVAGARPAQPGEFTRRAFLNGRLDLAQAEAVADLVQARTLGSALAAARQLGGELSHTLQRLRDELVELLALIEAQLDFGDEIELPQEQTLAAVHRLQGEIARLHATYRQGSLLRDGARVTLVGRPNVGKSSLLNALLGSERAIVTAVAGTTRDTLEEVWDCAGIPTVLTDTAGLRGGAVADPVEQIGMERTVFAAMRAHLCLLVLDRSEPLQEEDLVAWRSIAERPHIVVLNKSDLLPVLDVGAIPRSPQCQDVVTVSARERFGLLELRNAIARALSGTAATDDSPVVLTHPRHAAALQQALEALDRATRALADGLPLDIVSVELRAAADALRTVTGEVGAEDVLDHVFARFCLGK